MNTTPSVSRNSREKNSENSLPYKEADRDLNGIGNFIQGADENVSNNEITRFNNTLVFEIQNPTGVVQNVNLFGFTNGLFAPGPANPPPSILSGITFPVGLDALDTEYCPTNNFLYLCDPTGDAITVYDCTTNAVVASIALPVGYAPSAIAYCPVNNQMYVGSGTLLDVTRIDCATNAIVGVGIVTGGFVGGYGMAYNSVKNSMYIVTGPFPSSTMQEISCTTNLVVSSFAPAGSVALTKLAFNPVLNRMYVADGVVVGLVNVIDCVTNLSLISIVLVAIGGPSGGIAFCSANNFIYVCGGPISDVVVPVDTVTNIPGVAIATGLGTSPESIAYNPLNNLLYVNLPGSSSFSVINPVTNLVVSTTLIGFAGPMQDVVYNSVENSVWFNATFAGFGEVASFTPLLPPSAIVVLNNGFTLGEIFNDLLGKPVVLKGMKMIVDNQAQLRNNIDINTTSIYGKVVDYQFQPLNYVSPTNRNGFIIDAGDFEAIIEENNSSIILNVEPLSSLIISFTVVASVDNTVPLFENIVDNWGAGTDKSDVIRYTGNPIVDMILEREAEKILSDSNYTSIVQYADYPRVTGNAIADIALLNGSGLT